MKESLNLFKDHIKNIELSELKNIRQDISPLLNEPILRHFTDHSILHSDRMVTILYNILKDNLSKDDENKLNHNELYILLLSIYLHDIALQIPKAFGIETEISDFGKKEYNFIRENHGETVGEILEDFLKKGKDEYKISININKPMIKPYIPSICKICSRHQSNIKYDPNEKISLEGDPIRIGILTGLLRIADQLDCDNRRVDMDKLDRYSISLDSKIHWIACHYIDSVNIKNGNIRVIASFPESLSSAIISYISDKLTEKIKSELELCIDELWENNIQLRFGDKIYRQKWDLSISKINLPDDIKELITEKIVIEKPKHIKSKSEKDIKKIDWISYWGMIGNPFLDQPLSYGSKYFIETKKYQMIISEIDSLLKANQGDTKLLIGERGLGKTTLFEAIKGQFEDEYLVDIIDAADLVKNVNNSTELYIKLFTDIDNKLFKFENDKFDKDRFLEKLHGNKIRLICIDSLDRLPKDKDQILRDFFKQTQHILTSMKKNTLLILSCADRWLNFLKSSELSYLGVKNQWTLNKFQTEEIKSMLDKRLISSGRSYLEIFEEDCIGPLQAMSSGNPRQILLNAENVLRLAQDVNKKKIDAEFFREKYKNFFEHSYSQLIEKHSNLSPDFKQGLISIYCYYCDMERRNVDINLGFDLLTQLTQTEIKQSDVKIYYHGPLQYIAKIITKKDNEHYINYYTLHDEIKILFKILKDEGYSAKGFLSFYTLSPDKFIPSEDKEDILNKFKEYSIITEDVGYYEQARTDYINLKKNVKMGHIFIRKSWDVLENIILAILIRMNKINIKKYESDKDKIFYYDHLERKRYVKNAGQLMEQQSKYLIELLKESFKEKHLFMTYLPGTQWIRFQRNNIVKGRSGYYSKYGEKSIDICKNHLDLSFKELIEIYERIRTMI